jgi:hypothetical protein
MMNMKTLLLAAKVAATVLLWIAPAAALTAKVDLTAIFNRDYQQTHRVRPWHRSLVAETLADTETPTEYNAHLDQLIEQANRNTKPADIYGYAGQYGNSVRVVRGADGNVIATTTGTTNPNAGTGMTIESTYVEPTPDHPGGQIFDAAGNPGHLHFADRVTDNEGNVIPPEQYTDADRSFYLSVDADLSQTRRGEQPRQATVEQ